MNTVHNISLVEESREEYEANLSDYIRFQNHEFYRPEDLHYFKDPSLRQLFEAVFHESPRNIRQLLQDAVNAYPGSKYRIEQVCDLILRSYVKDGKLIIKSGTAKNQHNGKRT